MGAWGYGLFQSDHDLDLVWECEEACAIKKLEEDLKARAKADELVKARFSRPATNHGQDEDDQIHVSIYANHCSTEAIIDEVRKHLDSGALAEGIKQFEATEAKGNEDSLRSYAGYDYCYVLLGACAMTIGASLPATFKQGLKAKYKHIGLMPDGYQQMKKALFGPSAYVDGTAYDFQSLGLLDTMAQGMAEEKEEGDRGGFVGMNVIGPGSMFAPSNADKVYAADVCGGCGEEEADDGTALLDCASCKGQKYCSKECQKKHWKKHKALCKASTA